ncbi:hypothetical protein ACFCZ5_19330 [Streptomyces microflavus]|uniref:hypothetical protein n=1 Tax=Streptomyces microflavus TaxID=1919 RepID=UPI0035D8E90E
MGASRGLQQPEARDGRYFALDTMSSERATVEILKSCYQALELGGSRSMLAVPAVLLVGAAYLVLAAGEVRRADPGAVVPVPDTDGTPEIQGVPFPGAEPLNPA